MLLSRKVYLSLPLRSVRLLQSPAEQVRRPLQVGARGIVSTAQPAGRGRLLWLRRGFPSVEDAPVPLLRYLHWSTSHGHGPEPVKSSPRGAQERVLSPPRGAVLSLAAASASRHRAREATGGLRGSCAAQHRSPPHTCAVAGRAVANAVSPARQRTGRDALPGWGAPSRFSAEAAETLC